MAAFSNVWCTNSFNINFHGSCSWPFLALNLKRPLQGEQNSWLGDHRYCDKYQSVTFAFQSGSNEMDHPGLHLTPSWQHHLSSCGIKTAVFEDSPLFCSIIVFKLLIYHYELACFHCFSLLCSATTTTPRCAAPIIKTTKMSVSFAEMPASSSLKF